MDNFTYNVDTNLDATDTRSEAKKRCDAAFEADKKGLLSTPDVYDVQTSRLWAIVCSSLAEDRYHCILGGKRYHIPGHWQLQRVV